MTINLKLITSVCFLMFLILVGCESNDQSINNTPVVVPDSGIDKKVVIEFFTNSGCAPCVQVHNYLDQITALTGVTINDTNIIVVSFHWRYPYQYDSLFLANPVQNNARAAYYGIISTPNCFLNGVTMGAFSSTDWTSLLNTELLKTNYMNISLTKSYDSLSRNGSVTANVNLLSSLPSSDLKLHMILTESNIFYPTATNGIDYFNDVMRNMITGQDGEDVTLILGNNPPVTKTFNLSNNWNDNNCYLNIYIQSSSSKRVFGTEKIKVK